MKRRGFLKALAGVAGAVSLPVSAAKQASGTGTKLAEANFAKVLRAELGGQYGFGLAPVKAEGAAVEYDHVSYGVGFMEDGSEMPVEMAERMSRALKESMRQTRQEASARFWGRKRT